MILTVSISRSSYHHGDLRAALIAAALEIIDRKGIDALTLRAASRRAGVSHAAPAHHFQDKRGLLAAVATEAFGLFRDALLAAAGAKDDARGRFRRIGAAYIDFAIEHPARFRVMFHPLVADKEPYPDLAAASAAAFEVLLDGVTRAQDAGMVHRGEVRSIALFAWSVVHGFAALHLDGNLAATGFSAEPDALVAALTTEMHLGLRPGAPPPSP